MEGDKYAIVRRRLQKLGYSVSGGLRNTADFGLPQQRRRAWLLCHLQSEVQCSADELTSDINRFQRCNVLLDKCVDLCPNRTDTKGRAPTRSKKGDAGQMKWKEGFEQQCEFYGKVKLEGRVRTLKQLVDGCSDREICILAVAMEDMATTKGFDAMKQLAVIQDQNFDRATWARSDVSTTTCIIPGGKYVATGPAGFHVLSAKELEG
ncbi:unnamed protein product [Durusdinium trenchii]|uniref:DNA (cytosine-5-)-methyltransferase n=1 Tax=Durusdinium trenchii TaxID=1381693 RepID=A0ABP0SUS7_9DINO